MTEKKRGGAEHIGKALERLLQQSSLGDRVEQVRILSRWPELVGERIAAVTRPDSVAADGTLFVVVHSSPWAAELQFFEQEILDRLNGEAPERPFTRIRFRLRGSEEEPKKGRR